MEKSYKKGDMAMCINSDSGVGELTTGKLYKVIDIVSETIGIIDDTGEYETHGISRFQKIKS